MRPLAAILESLRRVRQRMESRKPRPEPGFVFEALEPRLLLSADYLPVEANAVTEVQSAPAHVVFIDNSIDDYESLASAAADRAGDVQVVVLDSAFDEVAQISQALERQRNLKSIAIVSHGRPGALWLGNTVLETAGLHRARDQLADWAEALAGDGDLLLYGCNVGFGKAGQEFIETLAFLTGADVAASDDATGSAVTGGDWDLEVVTGAVADSAFEAAEFSPFAGLLTINVTGEVGFSGDQTFNEPIVVTGPTTVTITNGGLTLGDDVTISGNGAGGTDSLTFIVGGDATVGAGGDPTVSIGGAGLLDFEIRASGDLDVNDGVLIDIEGHLKLSTNVGVDMTWTAVTPLFKDKTAETNITIGDVEFEAANVTIGATAANNKFSDLVVDEISLFATTPTPTASFTGEITFNENGTSEDTLVRDTGNWADDGFLDNKIIVVSNAGANNGVYLIEKITGSTLFLELNDDIDGGNFTTATVVQEEVPAADIPVLPLDATRALAPNTLVDVFDSDTLKRLSGDWTVDGFAVGDTIAIEDSWANDGVYQVAAISLDNTELTLASGIAAAPISLERVAMSGAPGLTFADNGTDLPTIVRSAGSWITDQFFEGMLIRISGAGANNGNFRIFEVSEDGLTLTLDDTATLTPATGVAGKEVRVLEEDMSVRVAVVPPAGSPPVTAQDVEEDLILNLQKVSKVLEFIPAGFRVILSDTTATINVASGAEIVAVQDVIVSAFAQSTVKAKLPALIAGVTVAESNATSRVTFDGKATAGDEFVAEADVNNNMSAATKLMSGFARMYSLLLRRMIPGPAIGASVGLASSTSEAKVGDSAIIDAKTVEVTAENFNTFVVSSKAKVNGITQPNTGVAIGVAVSEVESHADAILGGTVTARGDVLVESKSVDVLNDAFAKSVVKKDPAFGGGPFADRVSGFMGGLGFNSSSQAETFGAAASVAVADSINDAEARVGNDARVILVGAESDLTVNALAEDNFRSYAIAKVKAKGEQSGAAQAELAGAVLVLTHQNTATAYVGNGAKINAGGDINVTAKARIPNQVELDDDFFTLIALFSGNQPATAPTNSSRIATQEAGATQGNSFIDTTLSLVQLIKQYKKYKMIVPNKISTTYTQSAVTGNAKKVGISGSVTILTVTNSAEAYIGANAKINQAATDLPAVFPISTDQDVLVRADSLIETINIGGMTLPIKIPGVGKVLPFAQNKGNSAIGGTYLGVNYNNTAKAHVDDDAQVRAADDLDVIADSRNLTVSLALTGGESKKIGITGSGTFHDINNITMAWIEDEARVDVDGAVNVDAAYIDTAVIINGAITKGGKVAVGVAIAINDVDNDTKAFIGDFVTSADPVVAGSVVADDGVRIEATSETVLVVVSVAGAIAEGEDNRPKDDPLDGESLPNLFGEEPQEAVGQTAGISISGDVSINIANDTVLAFISNGVTVTVSGGSVTLNADNSSILVAASGAVSIDTSAASGGTSIAGAFTLNDLDREVRAHITGATVSDADFVSINAENDDILVSVTVGGGGSTRARFSVIGSVNLNLPTTTVEAAIGNSSRVTTDGSVTITARDHMLVVGVAGAFSLSGNAAIGAAADIGVASHTVHARIGDSAIVTAGDDIKLTANHDLDIISVAASLAIGTKGLGVTGAGASQTVTTNVLAGIGAGATVTTSKNLLLDAQDDLFAVIIGGSLGLGLGSGGGTAGAGVGASVANSNVKRTTRASIGAKATVKTKGNGSAISDPSATLTGNGILIDASASDQIFLVAIAGGIGKQVGFAASAAVDTMESTVEASIGAGAQVNATANTAADGVAETQDVRLRADHDTFVIGIGGAVGGGKTAGIGAAADVEVLSRTVKAFIDSGAATADKTVVNARNLISIQAASTQTMINIAAGFGFSSNVSLAGSAVVPVLTNTVEAYIGPSATVNAGSNVLVEADSLVDVIAVAGGVAIGGTASVGLAVSVVILTNKTEAWIDGSASVFADVKTGTSSINDATGLAHKGILIDADSNINTYIFSIGGGIGGTVAAAGSFPVTVIDNTTRAYIKSAATLPPSGSGIRSDGDVSVVAKSNFFLIGAGGSVAIGSTAGIGIGAKVGVLTQTTEAFIGERSRVTADDSVIVQALAAERIVAVSVSGSAAGTAALSITAGVEVMNLTAKAYIGSNAVVVAQGNVIVSAQDDTNVDLVVGNITGAGTFSGGLAGGVSVVTKKTESYIAANAQVTALAIRGSFNANTGAFSSTGSANDTQAGSLEKTFETSQVNYTTDSITITGHGFSDGDEVVYSPASEPVGGLDDGFRYFVKKTDSDTLQLSRTRGGAAINLTEVLPANGGPSSTDTHTIKKIDDVGVPGMSNDNFDTASVLNRPGSQIQKVNRKGVVVAAVSVNDLETAGIAVGGAGTVAIQAAGAVNVHDIDTKAHIDSGADINPTNTGAGSEQSVRVVAGRSYHSLAVGGSGSISGVFAGAPAAAVPILLGETEAFIGANTGFATDSHTGTSFATVVQATQDVEVAARARADIIAVGIGIAGSGVAGVAGSAAVIVIETDTRAAISGDVHVDADGNVLVLAQDDTQTISIAGAVGIGIAGGGGAGAAAVTVITKDTEAVIGGGAVVDADGQGTSLLAGIPTGNTDTNGSFLDSNGNFLTTSMRGVAVLAFSTEDLLAVGASGAGGLFVGIAGAVTVEVIDSNAFAGITGGAEVNQNTASSAHNQQSMNVSAVNHVDLLAVDGALGAGAAGVGASVDVGILRNDTTAFIGGGSKVRAKDTVDVNALSRRQLHSNAIAVGAGGFGLGGGIIVYSVGGNFSSSYTATADDGTTSSSNSLASDNGDVVSSVEGSVAGLMNHFQTGDSGPLTAFDPATAVHDTNDTIDLGANHGLQTGDAVVYSDGGGDAISGLTDGATYYAIYDPANPTRLKLATSAQNALNGNAIDISSTGATGTAHRLQNPSTAIGNSARDSSGANSPAGAISGATTVQTGLTSGTTAAIDGGATVTAGSVDLDSRQKFELDVLTGGLGGGLVGIGLGIGVVNVDADVSAFISHDVTVIGLGGAGFLTIDAQLDSTVRAIGFAGAVSGFVSLGGAVAVVSDTSDVRALLGARINANGNIEQASSEDSTPLIGGAGFANIAVTARSKILMRLATGAAGISAGAGLGAAITVASVKGHTEALIGAYSKIGSISAPVGAVSVSADQEITVLPFADGGPMGIALAGGLFAGSAGVTVVDVGGATDEMVRAEIGENVEIEATGLIKLSATSRWKETVNAFGGAIGLVAFGTMVAHGNVGGVTRARVRSGSHINGGGLSVFAQNTSDTEVNAISAGGGVGSGRGATAQTTIKPTVEALLGDVDVDVSGDVEIEAISLRAEGNATGKSFGGGGIDVGVIIAIATVTPVVNAYIDSGANITADGDVSVNAESKSQASGTPPVDTFASGDVNLLEDTIDFDYGFNRGDLIVYENNGNTNIGGLEDGRTYPILRSEALAAGGYRLTLGSIFAGTAAPVTRILPAFDTADVSDTNETIAFTSNHGLLTGTKVIYDNGGGTSIGGLTDGTLYYVIALSNDPKKLKLATSEQNAVNGIAVSLDPATGSGDDHTLAAQLSSPGVNDRFDTITFAAPHNLLNGDAVVYEAATTMSGTVEVGGLQDDTTYYVRKIDDFTIKLFASEAAAEAGVLTSLYALKPEDVDSDNDTITLSGTALQEGDAVTYRAPPPQIFSSLTVDVQVGDDNKIVFSSGQPVIENNDRIYIATLNNSGNPIAGHGFVTGDAVRYQAADGPSIGGLVSGQTYYVIRITDYVIQLAASLDATNPDDPDIANDVGVTPIVLTPDTTANGQKAVHTLIRTSELPIAASNATGGALQTGVTYYVRNLTNDSGTQTFKLSETPDGAILNLDTAGLGAAVVHRLGREGVDLTQASGQHALRIDLSGTVTGTHKLLGPGGVELDLVAPPAADGQSAAVVQGGGGGIGEFSFPTAGLSITPTVKAYIAATLIDAGGDVSITANSATNVTSSGDNRGGGIIKVGAVHARATHDATTSAFVGVETASGLAGSGVTIRSGGDFVMKAASNATLSVSAISEGGGLIGAAISDTAAYVDYDTLARVGSSADIQADGHIKISTDASASASTYAKAFVIAVGGGADADDVDALGFDGNVRIGSDSAPALSHVEIGGGAVLEGSTVDLHAKVSNLSGTATSDAQAYSPIFLGVATAFADVSVDIDSSTAVLIKDGTAQKPTLVKGTEGVDVEATHASVTATRSAFALAIALIPPQGTESPGEIDLTALVDGDPLVTVFTGPRLTDAASLAASALASPAGFTHLALYGQASNGTVSGAGSGTLSNNIVWDSDVIITSGPNPKLVVDASGNIVTAINASVNDDGNATRTSGEITEDDIIVNDILNDDGAEVLFNANVISGSQSLFSFLDTFDSVTIINESTKDLVINKIDVVNASASDAFNPPRPRVELVSPNVNITFDLARDVASTGVTIENRSDSHIGVNNLINNPIGGTVILNTGGDIVNGEDIASFVLDANGKTPGKGTVRTNQLDIEAEAGRIGVDGSKRIYVELIQSTNRPEDLVAGAGGDIYLELKGILRLLDTETAPAVFSVDVTSITAGDDADVRLQAASKEVSSALRGKVRVNALSDSTEAPDDFFATHYHPDGVGPKRDAGAFGGNASGIESTYDFELIQAGGAVATGDIRINSSSLLTPDATRSNVVNITGNTNIIGTGHIDADTNGFITFAETAGDMRTGEIKSRFDDVTLTAPVSIVDAPAGAPAVPVAGDGAADVLGVDITLTATTGGIGSAANFLEIDSSNAAAGKLTAIAALSIYIIETSGNLNVNTVESTAGSVTLVTAVGSGSILDVNPAQTAGEDMFNVKGINITLDANGGSIGSTDNDLEIDSSTPSSGRLAAEATSSIFIAEIDGVLNVLLAEALDGAGSLVADIRLTVRESTDTDEDLVLLGGGTLVFSETDTRTLTRGRIAAGDSIELRVGDDVTTASAGDVLAGLDDNTRNIIIRGDFGNEDTGSTVSVVFGTTMLLRGAITPGSMAKTEIFGGSDADSFTFDQTLLGGVTRVYGSAVSSAPANAAVNDGEDTFIVLQLQTMNVAALHTLTLDGQADTDSYRVDTTGSRATGAVVRNYVINVLDSGAKDDGADTLDIFGFDSLIDGAAGGAAPGDDIFLLRRANVIAGKFGDETAEAPAFVALLHGTIDEARIVDLPGAPVLRPQEVQRINYDANLNGRLSVFGLGGNDWFATDDNSAITTLDGGSGNDNFQIGQIYGSQRIPANVPLADQFETIATTRGYVSHGITAPLLAQGGPGDDNFSVYSNKGELRLEGDAGNDLFIVRAFALAETNADGTIKLDVNGVAIPLLTQFSTQQQTQIKPGDGDDTIQYNVNAPVSIDGGSGFDKVLVLGTEFPDNFVITQEGVFGAGLTIRFDNVEIVEVDGLEGDDDFFVISTPFGVATRLIGGLGSDNFNIAGDVSENIVSRELESLSGIINHAVTSADLLYNQLPAPGIDLNVLTPGQGVVVIEESNGTTVREGAVNNTDSYTVKLAVEPAVGTIVYVTVSAARSQRDEEEDGGDSILVRRAGDASVDATTFMRTVVINGASTPVPSRATVLTFDKTDWNTAKTVHIKAVNDTFAEGERVVIVSHSVSVNAGAAAADKTTFNGAAVRNVEVAVLDDDAAGLIITESNGETLVLEGSLTLEAGFTKGIADSYTIQLAKAPSGTVTVNMAFDAAQIALSSPIGTSAVDSDRFSSVGGLATLRFDASDWSAPVTINVTAANDNVREDRKVTVISHTANKTISGRDTAFDNVVSQLDVDVLDDEAAGVLVQETNGSTLVSKDGTTLTDTYAIRLTSAPQDDVTIHIITDGKTTATPSPLTFTAGNWWIPQTVTVAGVSTFAPAEGTEDLKAFSNTVHLLSNLRGPLQIEGGSIGPRVLVAAVILPGENNTGLLGIGQPPPETEQIDIVNIYDDSSQEDKSGTLSSVRLTGFNMAPDLVFASSAFGEPLGFPGGISFGQVSVAPNGSFQNNGSLSTIEVLNVMLGSGNDNLAITGTLLAANEGGAGPAKHGTLTVIHGGGNSDSAPGAPGIQIGGDTITVTGGGGPGSPLVIFGDTSQDGSWYAGDPNKADRKDGLTLGLKLFDQVGAADDLFRFARANPYAFNGNDVINAAGLAVANMVPLNGVVTVGVTIYGGEGNDTINGSSAGDHLAGGSDNDTINGNAGVDLIYGDSGSNIDLITRTLIVPTADTATYSPALARVRDELVAGIDQLTGGANDDIIFGDHGIVTQAVLPKAVYANNLTWNRDADGVPGPDAKAVFGTFDQTTGGRIETFFDSSEKLLTTGLIRRLETTQFANGAADTIGDGSADDASDDMIFGGNGADTISAGAGANVVFGDHGLIVGVGTGKNEPVGEAPPNNDYQFTLTRVESIESAAANGAVDAISTGIGRDMIFGGQGGDAINAFSASGGTAALDGNNIVFGDFGLVDYLAEETAAPLAANPIRTDDIDRIWSLFTADGGNDVITTGDRNDIVLGAIGTDTIHAGQGQNLLLGDSGRLTAAPFDATPSIWAVHEFTVCEIETTGFADGDADTIFGSDQNDVIFGGAGGDLIYAGAGNDLVFGDHGKVDCVGTIPFVTTNLPPVCIDLGGNIEFFALNVDTTTGAGDDIVFGGSGDDVILGQQGNDILYGEGGDDDLIGGHNVAGGLDGDDFIDGGAGVDVIAGDNADICRRGDLRDPRMQVLSGTAIYGESGPNDATALLAFDPLGHAHPGWTLYQARHLELLDHNDVIAGQTDPQNRFWGQDYLAGGAGDDVLFGQLGDDVIQGDGTIDGRAVTTGTTERPRTPLTAGARIAAFRNAGNELVIRNGTTEAASDGDDYIEGNGGDDVIFGNLGQDDIIGGSSELFNLVLATDRPDGADLIFGGAGVDLVRNDAGDTAATGHARDADVIAGDNANIFRIVGTSGTPLSPAAYLTFNYDNYTSLPGAQQLRIVPRVVEWLDYTPGGIDYGPAATADRGGGDEVHGESGDDVIYGMKGDDVLFGEGQDDDVIGGYGHDWISGGAGEDGILGDDGRVYTSRNSATVGEPLFGIGTFLTSDPASRTVNGNVLNEAIATPGSIQQAIINVAGKLKKTVNLTPFNVDPETGGQDPLFDPLYADDILFGGLGDDFLHGGAGDDAISGGEALPESYVQIYGANGILTGVVRSDYARPFNPGDALRFNPDDPDGWHFDRTRRAGEFALYDEYDPRRNIQLILTAADPAANPTGSMYKGQSGVTFGEFLLNFRVNEGIVETSGGTYGQRFNDGNDAIFGDLGNDWLVGGTGRDNLYGGYGNDLLNADDDHSTNGGLNDIAVNPDGSSVADTHPSYEDRAYGGAGRDVLIANTGGDRLMDWVGEFNSYLVPFAPFGMATVSRTLQPQLAEFLVALSASDGADPTRDTDAGTEAVRYGEPEGELGMVRQQDFDWNSQTGAPTDPQAGNIPGGARDVLRSASFNDGSLQGFAADSGIWQVSGGGLQVSSTSPQSDAISVYHIGDALPVYFEVRASIKAVKPTGGWKANAYVIFDYQSATDFKFAGMDVSTNQLVMGHRDANGWVVDSQAPYQGGVKADTFYNMLLSVNGLTASLVIDNTTVFTHTYAPRVVDGYSYGLNWGLVGVGSDRSRGAFDNIAVQVLPPQITFQNTEDFADGSADYFTGEQTGAWEVSGSRYNASPAGGSPAMSLMDLGVEGLNTNAVLDLSARVRTQARAGLIFDYYAGDDFKFVAIDAPSDRVILGHYTAPHGWVFDVVVSRPIDAGVDYAIGVSLRGSTVSVSINSQLVLSKSFNAVTVDGDFGLFATDGSASFDEVTVKTNDPAFLQTSEAQTTTESQTVAAALSSPSSTLSGTMTASETLTLTPDFTSATIDASDSPRKRNRYTN